MELKLLTEDNKVKNIDLNKFLENLKSDSFYYFSNETSYKDLQDLLDILTEKGYSVYFREVKYSLENDGYIYELHII